MQSFAIQKGNVIQKIDSKINIFDYNNSYLYTLNKSATEIFSYIKRGLSVNKIIGTIEKKYSIPHKRAEKDVNELIADLLKKNILLIKR